MCCFHLSIHLWLDCVLVFAVHVIGNATGIDCYFYMLWTHNAGLFTTTLLCFFFFKHCDFSCIHLVIYTAHCFVAQHTIMCIRVFANLKQNLSTCFLLLYLQDSYLFIIPIFCINKCNLNTRNKNCLQVTKNALFWLCNVCISFSGNTQCVLYVIMCAITQGNLNVNPCYSCSTDNSAHCLSVTNQVFSLRPPFCGH